MIEAIQKKKPFPEFPILDVMQMLDVAWGKITTKTVVNCFEKAGISKKKQSEALLDADDSFKDFQECTESLMTDDMTLCDVLDEEGSETEDDTDDNSNEPICPQSSDVRQALDLLWEYMLFSDNGEFIYKSLNEISVLVKNKLSAKLRKADIWSFFQ